MLYSRVLNVKSGDSSSRVELRHEEDQLRPRPPVITVAGGGKAQRSGRTGRRTLSARGTHWTRTTKTRVQNSSVWWEWETKSPARSRARGQFTGGKAKTTGGQQRLAWHWGGERTEHAAAAAAAAGASFFSPYLLSALSGDHVDLRQGPLSVEGAERAASRRRRPAAASRTARGETRTHPPATHPPTRRCSPRGRDNGVGRRAVICKCAQRRHNKNRSETW